MPGTIPINISWSQQGGFSVSPANPQIGKGGTARFNASNKACTVSFNPTTTPFGASINVPQGPSVDIPVGDSDYEVSFSVSDSAAAGNVMAASAMRVMSSSGTIKVGSG